MLFELDDALHFLGKTRSEFENRGKGGMRVGYRRVLVNWRRFKTAYREKYGKEYKVER
jgi:hypothetical protein